ncbi:IS110 family transposase [Shewanella sp. JM162201]|uniref:IS110 family transposase n=1 Tax=Shewanella jiangmenensis TaxID=2837387 RepID=A0ABS5UYX1_9GAMM|nr:IS110 family transposase [Shewanella jiangmenensis]MBT1443337.1 IS110 family transposase [Shewanella jiangmenensis]
MKASTVSIDLAKSVFQVLGVTDTGKKVFSKRLSRQQFIEFIPQLESCHVVMEACMSSHYWARCFVRAGHRVELLPAQYVTPFVRGNKNDKNDCLAIYEASQRPGMRFVPIKTENQQSIMALHRQRDRLIAGRTACVNQTRSLLLEFGVIIHSPLKTFRRALLEQLDNPALPPLFRLTLNDVIDELAAFDVRLGRILGLIKQLNDQSEAAQILLSLPGVGPIIASAFSACIDKGQAFSSADELPVWLGLTPRQYASGNTNRLGNITKRGDGYLRKQLIHGARTVVSHAHKKQDDLSRWVSAIKARRGINKAVVATARRLARLMWILLQRQTRYQPQFGQGPCQMDSQSQGVCHGA